MLAILAQCAVLLTIATLAVSDPDAKLVATDDDVRTIRQEAERLAKEGDYEGAIALLDPVFERTEFTALLYDSYHTQLNKRHAFLVKARARVELGPPYLAYAVAWELHHRVLRDAREIERYYLMAHRRGYVDATVALATIYYLGLEGRSLSDPVRSIQPNLDKAREMFLICKEARAECKTGLGFLHLERHSDSPGKAVELLRAAESYPALWAMYYFGIGVEQDKRIADEYCSKGATLFSAVMAEKRSVESQQFWCLGLLNRNLDSFREGDNHATISFADELGARESIGCFPRHRDTYLTLLEKAAGNGSPWACERLANQYQSGKYVPKDLVLAYYYSLLELFLADPELQQKARDRRQQLEAKMSVNATEEAQALFRQWRQARSKPPNSDSKGDE